MEIDMNEKVDFSYPEGFQKAVDSLAFLPEAQRAAMLVLLISSLNMFL